MELHYFPAQAQAHEVSEGYAFIVTNHIIVLSHIVSVLKQRQ